MSANVRVPNTARVLAVSFASIVASLILLSCTNLPKDVDTNPAGKEQAMEGSFNASIQQNAGRLFSEGRDIFRYDTFGSEAFWGDQLKLHRAIAGDKFGGTGPGLTAKQALQAGLKVDTGKLPGILVQAIKGGSVNLERTDTTIELLRANAVVGVKGSFDKSGRNLVSIGITCAFCHSTVDDSLAKGIGRRLDGWPNRDLNVGAIVSLAPDLGFFAKLLNVDTATVKKVLASWGPGKYDAELNLDGKAFRPDGKAAATLIPPAFGLTGVNHHTWTGGWGTVTYWNAFVANLQMRGQGTFFDARLMNPKQYPVAAKAGFGNKRDANDLITAKLGALNYYATLLDVVNHYDTFKRLNLSEAEKRELVQHLLSL